VQVEAADLRGRDVNVVGAGEVGSVRRAQKAEAIREDFHRSFAVDAFAFFGLVFQEGEDEVLLAHPVGAVNFVGDGHFQKFGDVLVFQVGQVHGGKSSCCVRGGADEGKGGNGVGTCARALPGLDFAREVQAQNNGFRCCCQ
jgi:hypothetical protein